MSEYHDNSPESLRFAISALQDRLDKLTAPSASADQWAQLASDCGVTPACDTREEFVALMKQVVGQASVPAASPEVMEVDDAMATRVLDRYQQWLWDEEVDPSRCSQETYRRLKLEAMKHALTAALKGKK